MNDNNHKLKKVYNKIGKAERILLAIHDRPDGDAVSSICAVIEILENLEKKYFAFCKDEIPWQMNFLPHTEKISTNIRDEKFSTFDTIIILDCGSLTRSNLVPEITSRNKNQTIIEFDHHPKVDDYADIEIRMPNCSSTSEVLYFFLKANKIKINKNLANCILTGILTDTGNLLYPSTSDITIKIASEMLTMGARFPSIIENTSRNKSLSAMKVWGQAMSNLTINKKYNIAFSILPEKDIIKYNIEEEELEGISGFLSNLYGVKGLLLLKEEGNNKIKGSLRTAHPDVDISQLAQVLGGGGHIKSSGFAIEGEIKKINGKWNLI